MNRFLIDNYVVYRTKDRAIQCTNFNSRISPWVYKTVILEKMSLVVQFIELWTFLIYRFTILLFCRHFPGFGVLRASMDIINRKCWNLTSSESKYLKRFTSYFKIIKRIYNWFYSKRLQILKVIFAMAIIYFKSYNLLLIHVSLLQKSKSAFIFSIIKCKVTLIFFYCFLLWFY